jgi:hypothetical protein
MKEVWKKYTGIIGISLFVVAIIIGAYDRNKVIYSDANIEITNKEVTFKHDEGVSKVFTSHVVVTDSVIIVTLTKPDGKLFVYHKDRNSEGKTYEFSKSEIFPNTKSSGDPNNELRISRSNTN